MSVEANYYMVRFSLQNGAEFVARDCGSLCLSLLVLMHKIAGIFIAVVDFVAAKAGLRPFLRQLSSRQFAVQSHRGRNFKLSNDPYFVEKVRASLAARPHFHLHFTPTYSPCLNQVERRFGLISQQAIRRGSFKRVKEPIAKISHFVQHYNRNSKPFA